MKVLALTILATIVGCYCFDVSLYISGDNVELMRYGEALRQGHLSLSNGKYPFIVPAILALVQMVSDNSLFAQKVFILMCYIVSVPLTYIMARQHIGIKWGMFSAILFAFSPLAIEFSHYVMSEMPYVAASLGALILLQRSEDEPHNRKPFYIALLMVVLTFYVRTIGLALIAGTMVFYWSERKWLNAMVAPVIFIASIIPMQIANSLTRTHGYLDQLILKNPYDLNSGMVTFSDILSRIGANAQVYILQDIPLMIFPLSFESTLSHCEPYPPDIAVWMTFVVAVLGMVAFYHGAKLIFWYALAYMGVIMLWPEVWAGERFLMPMLPIGTFLIALGGYYAEKLLNRKMAAIIAILFLLVFGRNVIRFNYLAQTPPVWKIYYATAEWIRDNTEASAIIADRKGTLMGYVSKRQTTGIPRSLGDVYKLNIDYIVISSNGYTDYWRYGVPIISRNPRLFELVYSNQVIPHYVFKVRK